MISPKRVSPPSYACAAPVTHSSERWFVPQVVRLAGGVVVFRRSSCPFPALLLGGRLAGWLEGTTLVAVAEWRCLPVGVRVSRQGPHLHLHLHLLGEAGLRANVVALPLDQPERYAGRATTSRTVDDGPLRLATPTGIEQRPLSCRFSAWRACGRGGRRGCGFPAGSWAQVAGGAGEASGCLLGDTEGDQMRTVGACR